MKEKNYRQKKFPLLIDNLFQKIEGALEIEYAKQRQNIFFNIILFI